MDSQTLYNALVNRGISEEQLERVIAKKSDEYGGYISKEGILFLIAKEYGIFIIEKENEEENRQDEEQEIDYDESIIYLKDIQEGMVNISVIGRIEKVYGVREFTRKDTSYGKVGSFLLNDGTYMLKINLWDSQTLLMEQEYFRESEIIRIINCYTKKNQKTNKLELHTSKKSRLKLAPTDIDIKRFPPLNHLIFNSCKNNKRNKDRFTSISGTMSKIIYFKEKLKAQGERTFILRFLVNNKTDSYPVNVFGMKAVEILRQISEGKTVSLANIILTYNPYTQQEEIYFKNKSTLTLL